MLTQLDYAEQELEFLEDVFGVRVEPIVPGQEYKLMSAFTDACLVEKI